MITGRRNRFLLGAAAVFVAMTAHSEFAMACSCVDDGLVGEALMSARFQKASDVVRGKVLTVNAGRDVVRLGSQFVVGKLQIDETLKGDLKGEIEVITGFGAGDCGLPGALLISIAWDRQVELAVRRVTEREPLYVVDMCGYGKVLPEPPAK